MVGGGVFQSAPGSHEHVGEDVLGTVGVDATPDVALERIEDLVDDGLKPLSAVDCGAHLWPMSRSRVILSARMRYRIVEMRNESVAERDYRGWRREDLYLATVGAGQRR